MSESPSTIGKPMMAIVSMMPSVLVEEAALLMVRLWAQSLFTSSEDGMDFGFMVVLIQFRWSGCCILAQKLPPDSGARKAEAWSTTIVLEDFKC
jgi:hypothetical protein